MDDDDPVAVEHMVHYLYQLDYVPTASSDCSMTEGPTADESQAIYDAHGQISYVPQNPSPVIHRRCVYGAYAEWDVANAGPSSAASFGVRTKEKKGKTYLTDSELNEPFSSRPTTEPNLLLHVSIYALADKYGIQGLKTLAAEKFHVQAREHWDNPEFPQAMHEVYESTPDNDRQLRDIVTEALQRNRSLVQKPEVGTVIKEINGLAYDLLRIYSERNETARTCFNCGTLV